MNATPQTAFVAGLLDPACPAPEGLIAWNGSDAARRYAVYRNNVTISLINALQDSFPVCCEWIGAKLFRDLAVRFARSAPPRSPVMAEYGASFPEFVARTEVSRARPELSDLARLEFLRVRAYHAADAQTLAPEALTAILTQHPDALPALRLQLHPAVNMLDSSHAIVSIWAAHQGLMTFEEIDLAQPQSAVVTRAELDVEVLLAPPAVTDLLRRLASGCVLGIAAAETAAAHADFDLSAGLAFLIRHRLLSSAAIT